MFERECDKYLRKNPAAELNFAAGFLPSGIIVVPVYDEYDYLPETLANWAEVLPENFALILVFNLPPDAPDATRKQQKSLQRQIASLPQICLQKWQILDLGVITGGVGQARKSGLDAAVRAFPVAQMPLLCLDADTWVDGEYAAQMLHALQVNGAVSCNVRHRKGETAAAELAIREYEKYLDHYQTGLQLAGSPYAYKSIGSAMACTVKRYIAAHGMRVRTAGEDFYFLQALAKSGGVFYEPQIHIYPSARYSHRVPFGTGRQIEALQHAQSLTFFNAGDFAILKQLLTVVNSPVLSNIEAFLTELDGVSRQFLTEQNWPAIWAKVLNQTRQAQLVAAFNLWFDALKTWQYLKFVHEQYSAPGL